MACEQDGGPLCGSCVDRCRFSEEGERDALRKEHEDERKSYLLDDGYVAIENGRVYLTELGYEAVSDTRSIRCEIDELFPERLRPPRPRARSPLPPELLEALGWDAAPQEDPEDLPF